MIYDNFRLTIVLLFTFYGKETPHAKVKRELKLLLNMDAVAESNGFRLMLKINAMIWL